MILPRKRVKGFIKAIAANIARSIRFIGVDEAV